jgi:hypothetical protein
MPNRENRTRDPHLEMMGDETEEQNLNQPGHPEKRIKKEEVEKAFGRDAGKDDKAKRKPH